LVAFCSPNTRVSKKVVWQSDCIFETLSKTARKFAFLRALYNELEKPARVLRLCGSEVRVAVCVQADPVQSPFRFLVFLTVIF
jgi:hypothetical protein